MDLIFYFRGGRSLHNFTVWDNIETCRFFLKKNSGDMKLRILNVAIIFFFIECSNDVT